MGRAVPLRRLRLLGRVEAEGDSVDAREGNIDVGLRRAGWQYVAVFDETTKLGEADVLRFALRRSEEHVHTEGQLEGRDVRAPRGHQPPPLVIRVGEMLALELLEHVLSRCVAVRGGA